MLQTTVFLKCKGEGKDKQILSYSQGEQSDTHPSFEQASDKLLQSNEPTSCLLHVEITATTTAAADTDWNAQAAQKAHMKRSKLYVTPEPNLPFKYRHKILVCKTTLCMSHNVEVTYSS